MERQKTAVEWLMEEMPDLFLHYHIGGNINEGERKGFIEGFKASQQLNGYSKRDMESFAHYLRNGLTNLEYSEKEHDEHLADWEKDYRRPQSFDIEIEETEKNIKIIKKL